MQDQADLADHPQAPLNSRGQPPVKVVHKPPAAAEAVVSTPAIGTAACTSTCCLAMCLLLDTA
jgi:hypothetical protein